MRSSDFAGLATLELRQHLRHRQHVLLATARRLRRQAGESEAARTAAGCARLCDGIERLGDLLESLLGALDPPARN